MLQVPIPGLNEVTQLLITAFIILIGIVILIVIVKVVLHFFLAIVGGVVVWLLTGNFLIGALGFLAVAIITTSQRKPTIVYTQPATKTCPRCRIPLAANARFCPNCGQSV